jgi:capsular exopolysaccharide synthesis family protein
LDALYGKPTLGVIGVIEGANSHRSDPSMVVTLFDSRSSVSEAFRALRTHIQFANPGQSIRSLLITSAGPEEGKTVTAANLAVSIAQGGSRVILVDADLRRPSIHRLFGLRKAPGFSNLIIDVEGEIKSYLQPTKVEGLWILPSGTLPPNPAELLGSPRAAEVMKRLEDYADIVIYDSPPAATVTDALILATRVEGVLQVVLAGHTRRDLVWQGRVALERVGACVLGPVLNRVPKSDLGYYHYYYYGYYHRDGDESGEEPHRPVTR